MLFNFYKKIELNLKETPIVASTTVNNLNSSNNELKKSKELIDEDTLRARYTFANKKRIFLYGTEGLSSRFENCNSFLNESILNDIYEFQPSKNHFVNKKREQNNFSEEINENDMLHFEDENLRIYPIISKSK